MAAKSSDNSKWLLTGLISPKLPQTIPPSLHTLASNSYTILHIYAV
jgi:hypothetical protein